MLSIKHNTTEFEIVIKQGGNKIIQKPKCILDYNNSMGTVGNPDMVISIVETRSKSLKWYLKYFFHMFDICVWIAYCLYKHN